MNIPPKLEPRSVVIFDSDCLLCARWIKLILKYEKSAEFYFASSRKKTGRALAAQYGFTAEDLEHSYLVIQNNQAYEKFDATFIILRQLKLPLKWLCLFRVIPKSILDKIYDMIAQNRFKWFGKKSDCFLPNPEIKSRFLDF